MTDDQDKDITETQHEMAAVARAGMTKESAARSGKAARKYYKRRQSFARQNAAALVALGMSMTDAGKICGYSSSGIRKIFKEEKERIQPLQHPIDCPRSLRQAAKAWAEWTDARRKEEFLSAVRIREERHRKAVATIRRENALRKNDSTDAVREDVTPGPPSPRDALIQTIHAWATHEATDEELRTFIADYCTRPKKPTIRVGEKKPAVNGSLYDNRMS